MRIRFTPSARVEFLDAVSFILQEDRRAAVRFRRRAEASLRRLKRFPQSGRIIPEFPNLPFREVIVTPYRFFHRVEKRVVWIVAVWHGARIPLPPRD